MSAINELNHFRILLGVVILGLCLSCVSITGLTDGYDKLSSANKEHVCYLREIGASGVKNSDAIYLVSAGELKKIIDRSNKRYQIVYEYNPNCPSEVCVPVSTFVSLCKKYDAEPILLARYLDNALFDLRVDEVPFYGIDHKMYKPRAVYKYVPLYLTDLTGREMKDDGSGNLFVFDEGSFVTRTDVNGIDHWFESVSPDR